MPIAMSMGTRCERAVWLLMVGVGGLIGCRPPETPFAATRAGQMLRTGDQKLSAEQYDAALAEFQKAIELDPKLAPAHSKIGFIQEKKGDYEAAAKAYSEAVKLNPFSFNDSLALAQVYQKLVKLAD